MDHQIESNSAPAEFLPSPSNDLLSKPIVIPQQTNIFHIKTFSPFARAYSPTLQTLADPISPSEFLAFIDGLNAAFLSSPIFQAAHVLGGGLLGSQILPAQAVGGVFQIASVLGSAGVSIIRVRKHMKAANRDVFAPRGLVVRVMSTKKMTAAIGFDKVEGKGKGKLALPPLDVLEDLTPTSRNALTPYDGSNPASEEKFEVQVEAEVEDPRMRRLKALEGFIAPLEFEKEAAPIRGAMDKYGGAPLRWMNRRQDANFQKAASRSAEHRRKNSSAAESEFRNSGAEIEAIGYRMQEIRLGAEKELEGELNVAKRYEIGARMESELADLEGRKIRVERERDEKVRGVYKKGDRKLEKLAKKEEKIVNRILWVVVMRADGTMGDELVDVGSLSD